MQEQVETAGVWRRTPVDLNQQLVTTRKVRSRRISRDWKLARLGAFDWRETCRRRNVKERAPSLLAFRVLLSGRARSWRTVFRFLPISHPHPSRETLSRNRNGPATWLSVASRFSELGVYMVRKWIDHPSIIVDRYSVLASNPSRIP